MTYYINPIWFYLTDVANDISIASMTIAILIGVTTIIGFVSYLFWKINEFSEDYKSDIIANKTWKKLLIVGLIVTIVSSFITIVTPTSDTIYKMMISSVVTYENVDKVKDDAKEIIDYITEKAIEIQSDKKDE